METWVRTERLYSGRVFNVVVGEARLSDGSVVPREMVEHPGGVAIVPVFEGTVVLIRQFRIALARDIIEIPAGKLDGGIEPERQAARELEEETGYRARVWAPQLPIFPSVGYTTEIIHLFLAFELEKTAQRLDFDERIEPVRIPIPEIEGRMKAGEFPDAKTFIGLQALLAHLAQHPEPAR